MEDIRPDNEDDDKDDSSSGKKKRADKVGLFGFDFKIEKPKKDVAQKREDLLSLLTRKTVEVENSQEAEAEELSVVEEMQIAKEIVLDHQAEYHDMAEAETDEQTLESLEAIDIFHDKILSEDLDSTQALAETLAEISNSDEHQPESSEMINLHQPAEKHDLTEEPVAIRPAYFEFKSAGKTEVSDDKPSVSAAQPIFDRVPNIEAPIKKLETKKAKAGNTFNEIIDNLLIKRQDSIKSEKAQTQVKKTLEKQVAKIEEEIITKELTVRQAAIEKVKSRTENIQESPNRAPAPEANRLHSSAPEKIGKVLLTAAESNRSTPRVETATLQPIDQHIETISRADLLELSAKTLVEGSTLRQAYETNLITEKGLRRILIEHLRGGDVKKALRRELVERDTDFERDPLMRDKSHQSQSGNSHINNLIMKVAPEVVNHEEQPLITFKSKTSIVSKKLGKKKAGVRWFDIGLVIVIAILLTLVLTLVMSR